MTGSNDFDLRDFTPYLLNMAAESSSLRFQRHYKNKYGMLRTEWRVLFHLGKYGAMHAKDICERARLHKTKVSRAVAALETKRFLKRTQSDADKRHETLILTRSGQAAFDDIFQSARSFDALLMKDFTSQEQAILQKCLLKIADL